MSPLGKQKTGDQAVGKPPRTGRAAGGKAAEALALHSAREPKLLLTQEINTSVGDVPQLGTESQMNKRPPPASRAPLEHCIKTHLI